MGSITVGMKWQSAGVRTTSTDDFPPASNSALLLPCGGIVQMDGAFRTKKLSEVSFLFKKCNKAEENTKTTMGRWVDGYRTMLCASVSLRRYSFEAKVGDCAVWMWISRSPVGITLVFAE